MADILRFSKGRASRFQIPFKICTICKPITIRPFNISIWDPHCSSKKIQIKYIINVSLQLTLRWELCAKFVILFESIRSYVLDLWDVFGWTLVHPSSFWLGFRVGFLRSTGPPRMFWGPPPSRFRIGVSSFNSWFWVFSRSASLWIWRKELC